MLFRKIMSNLKPFFSGRHEGSTKGTFEGLLGVWCMIHFVGVEENIRTSISSEVKLRIEAYHCLLPKKLSSNFSAQWRDDMRKRPNVILECFRGFGQNVIHGAF